ncbi:hypothetical protein EXS71_00365 [Candidatus Uhrbacteria bacterium]|nr:hypothetical protein [Candidatus Uhrbacteria bacterium]
MPLNRESESPVGHPKHKNLKVIEGIARAANKEAAQSRPATVEEKALLAMQTKQILQSYKTFDAGGDMNQDKINLLQKHLPGASQEDIFFVKGDLEEALSLKTHYLQDASSLKILAKAIVKWGPQTIG